MWGSGKGQRQASLFEYVPKNSTNSSRGRGRGRGRGEKKRGRENINKNNNSDSDYNKEEEHFVVNAKSSSDKVCTEQVPVLYTIGYGAFVKEGADGIITRMERNGVKRLIDIRISPFSSGSKDFVGKNLNVILEKEGLIYEHFMELGNVWRSQTDKLNELPTHVRLELYEGLIAQAGEFLTKRLRQRVENTLKSPNAPAVCIMCGCGDVNECHRGVVASYLQTHYNYEIRHI